MQIEVKIDSACTEPKIVITAAAMTEELNRLIQKLGDSDRRIISGIKDGKIRILEQDELFRVYASQGKVFAETDSGEYLLRQRLYEAEEKLEPSNFVRISSSELINLKKVKSFDLSFTGTIFVELMNGTSTYVSRRFVPKIKKLLGM